MKALLVIFIIYINYVICEHTKYAVKNYPKKVKPYGNGKILINSGKYEYKSKAPKGSTKTSKRSYTVFQVVGNSKTIQGVPDSPYFPVDQSYDHKPRVKKVLPDYAWSSGLRNKRSAVLESPVDTPIASTLEVTTTTITTTPAKPETTAQPKTETTLQITTEKKDDDEKEARKSSHNTDKKPNAKADTKKTVKPPAETDSDKKLERNSETKITKSTKTDKKDDGKNKNKDPSKSQMRAAAGQSTTAKEAKQKLNATNAAGKKNETKQLRVQKKKKPGHKGGSKTKKRGKARPKRTHKRKPLKHGAKGHNAPAPKATRRLIAAREALIEDYPYVVSLQKDDQHWCSGALLNPRLVITTANCLWKASRLSRMEVRAGSRHVDHGGQMAGIQEVMKHPGWGLRKNPDNDVALVLLDRFIRFSDSVHGVDLPNRVMMPPFDDAWVTSWGAERRDGVYDPDGMSLQVYHTRLMDRAKCNNITTRFSVVVTENFICLAQSGKTAPCTRDTGAPAVSDGILWGLASWGIRKLCGTERFPAMFSYLASHSNVDFLTNATTYLMSDQRHYPFADRFPMIPMGQNPNKMRSAEMH